MTVGVMSLMDDEEKLLATKLLGDAKDKVVMLALFFVFTFITSIWLGVYLHE